MSLARVLRGEEFSAVGQVNPDLPAIMERVEFHGIAGLLGRFALSRLPPQFKDEIRRMAVSQEFWEAQHIKRLRPVVEQLKASGACPLIFKGTALAYTRYAEPATRRRGDTDILVRMTSFHEACDIVRSFGFTAPINGLNVRALGARSFSTKDEHGFTHEIDLHQRINSSPIIAKLFPHNELKGRSDPISKLGSGASAIGAADALLVACFHRLIHRQIPYYVNGRSYLSSDRLIWLYDIKLLHETINGTEAQRILKLAEVKGLSAVLSDGLHAADQWLELGRDGLIGRLGTNAARELPYRYLYSGPARRWMLDLVSTQRKGRALVDLLAPPREHIIEKYGVRRLALLPLFYVWRALRGLHKATQHMR